VARCPHDAAVRWPLDGQKWDLSRASLPGWKRRGDEITRSFEIRYHGGVAMIVLFVLMLVAFIALAGVLIFRRLRS
jgi:hypothetical protein